MERRSAEHLFCGHSYSSVSSVPSHQFTMGCFGQKHILISLEISVQYLNLDINDHTRTRAMLWEEGGWAMRASVLVRQPASEDLPSQPLHVHHCPTQGKDTSKDTLPASKRQVCLVGEKFLRLTHQHQTSTVIPGLNYWLGFEWGIVGEVVGVWTPSWGWEVWLWGGRGDILGIQEGNPRQEIGGGEGGVELLEQEQDWKWSASCYTGAAGGSWHRIEGQRIKARGKHIFTAFALWVPNWDNDRTKNQSNLFIPF